MRFATTSILAALTFATPASAEGFLAVKPGDIAWTEVRKSPSLFRAYIQGDQDKPGAFTFRVRAAVT